MRQTFSERVYTAKVSVLALPRSGEARAMKGDVGEQALTDAEGYLLFGMGPWRRVQATRKRPTWRAGSPRIRRWKIALSKRSMAYGSRRLLPRWSGAKENAPEADPAAANVIPLKGRTSEW